MQTFHARLHLHGAAPSCGCRANGSTNMCRILGNVHRERVTYTVAVLRTSASARTLAERGGGFARMSAVFAKIGNRLTIGRCHFSRQG